MSVEIDQLQTAVAGLPGVQSVDMSAFPQRITIRCDVAEIRGSMADRVRALVTGATDAHPEIEVELVGVPTVRSGRARFESVTVRSTGPGRVAARVALEWQKQEYVGEADAESGPAGELRGCCLATLRAVENAAGGDVSFSLVGAKELRVFDHDLVAVLVHCAQLPQYRLIGTSIISEDRLKSAALAVLSATNRTVGQFGEGSEG